MSFRSALSRLNRRDYPIQSKVVTVLSVFLITLFAASLILSAKSRAADPPSPTYLQQQITACKGQSLCSWGNSYAKDIPFHGLDLLIDTSSMPKALVEGKPIRFGEWIPGGVIGSTNQAIASLFTPPASGVEYLAQMKDNFLGKPAYAQGAGFRGLQPILPLWRGFRNIVYVLSSLVFIFVGIMIMLRVKISPQAVINIQNAIPQIIITLILVTFSYAIAGLLIDLIFFLQGSALAILFSSVGKNLNENIIPGIQANTFTFATLSQPHLGEIFNLTFSAAPINIIMALGGLIGIVVGGVLGAPGNLPGIIGGAILGGLAGAAIFALILTILILFWIIKFFFGLVKCYFNIILKIILAPLEIGMGAIPGSKVGFNTWFNDIFANLMVFPISVLFLVLANLIITQIDNNNSLWVPSLISGNMFGNGTFLVRAAVGIAVLGLMSKLPEVIPQFIFMIKPSPWSQTVDQGIKEAQAFPSQVADKLHRYTGFRDDARRIRPPAPEAPQPIPVVVVPGPGATTPLPVTPNGRTRAGQRPPIPPAPRVGN